MHHLHTYALSALRTGLILALLIAVLAPLEHFFAVRRARFFYPGWATNLGWYFVNSLAVVFLLGPPTALIAWGAHALVPAAVTTAAASLPLAVKMVLAMIVGEIGFYWGHRLSHQWPLLWRFHAVHHSAEHMNFLVNMRAHPLDMIFTRVCGMVLLYASGLVGVVGPNPTLIPALVLFVGSMWSFLIHANVRWRFGPLEQIISTPAFHHWHHSRNDISTVISRRWSRSATACSAPITCPSTGRPRTAPTRRCRQPSTASCSIRLRRARFQRR